MSLPVSTQLLAERMNYMRTPLDFLFWVVVVNNVFALGGLIVSDACSAGFACLLSAAVAAGQALASFQGCRMAAGRACSCLRHPSPIYPLPTPAWRRVPP